MHWLLFSSHTFHLGSADYEIMILGWKINCFTNNSTASQKETIKQSLIMKSKHCFLFRLRFTHSLCKTLKQFGSVSHQGMKYWITFVDNCHLVIESCPNICFIFELSRKSHTNTLNISGQFSCNFVVGIEGIQFVKR